MPIANPLTSEDLANLPLDSSVNPNTTVKDVFNEAQRKYLLAYYNSTDEELSEFDKDFLKGGRQFPFSVEMEHLINTEKSKLREPLPSPLIPKGITEDPQWQEYIAKNAANPNFVPTEDPDEIANILDLSDEWFNKDKYFEGNTAEEYLKKLDESNDSSWLTKRSVEAMSAINWAGENFSPNAFRLGKYEAQKKLADAGITYSEGADVWERFKAALLPRNRDARDIESVVSATKSPNVDTLGYRLPSAEPLYPGRPKGEQGPIIRYQRNEDGTIEKIFPWNDPGITMGDWAEFVSREVPSIAAELAVTKRLRKTRALGLTYYKKPWTAVKDWGKYAAATGLSAAAGEFARISSGTALYDNDWQLNDVMKESALIGAYATGGNAAATAILNGARATWRFFTGKLPPDFVIKRLVDLRNNYQTQLKQLKITEGTPEARALFDDLLGKTPKEVQKALEEVTGKTYTIFPGDGQFNPDGDFALSLLNIMQRDGFGADKTIELLENQILQNQATRQLFAQRLLMQGGNPKVAKEAAADLGKQLDIKISEQLDGEIDEAWKVFSQAVEDGKADEALLKQLGIDDVVTLGIRPATNNLPGELGDDIAMSKYLFQKIDDPDSLINSFRNPTIRRLALTQKRYMAGVTKNLENLMEKYGAMSINLTPSSPLAKEVSKILKVSSKGTIFKNDKALQTWLKENIDGPDTRLALNRLQGRLGGKFGGADITFKELHLARVHLHELRNSLSGKMREPSERAVNDLISAIERQQHNMFKSAARRLKNPGEGIDTYMNRTDFGKNYWKTLTEYGEKSGIANSTFIKNLLKAGDESDASFMSALMSKKIGGNDFHPIADPLFKMLRDDSSDMGFQMITRAQRAIAAQYKKDVIEPFMGQQGKKKDFKGLKLAHEKWMNNHGGLIKAAFDEGSTKGQILRANWDNMTSTVHFVDRMIVQRDKTLAKIAEEFEPILGAAKSPEEMILRITRGEGLENVSGAIGLRKKLAKILKQSGDKDLEKNVELVIKKDIWNQIMDRGAGGQVTLNAKKLNELLTGEFPVGGGSGQLDVVSFEKLYEMFLSPKDIVNLKHLNAAAQAEARRLAVGTDKARAALALGEKESVEIPTIGRLIFGPLNPYTYRIGWRERALQQRVNNLLGESVLKPKLLDELVKKMNRKMDINDAIRFFNSLDSTIAHDIGRDLRELKGESRDDTSFLSEADENPILSAEYFNFLQEYANSDKKLPTQGGLLPATFRKNLESAPLAVPAAIATAGVSGVNAIGDWFSNSGAQ